MNNKSKLAAFRVAAIWDFDRWAYDEWERHNNAYFDGKLEVGPIFWGLTPYGNCIGNHAGWRNTITLHQCLIEWSITWQGGLSGRERIASDVLLHEMIHQSVYQRLGHSGCPENDGKRNACSSHNNEHWAAEVNRIAPLLGLPATAAQVRQKRVKPDGEPGKGKVTWYTPAGMMTRAELSSWPHSMRAKDYYRNVPAELANRLG